MAAIAGCVVDSLLIIDLLVLAQTACIFSVIAYGARRYPLTLSCFVAAIPATMFISYNGAWLDRWFLPVCMPVAALRFCACLEVAHRQTAGFRYWSRLAGAAMLIASAAAGVIWIHFTAISALGIGVEIRRWLQVWGASMLVALEVGWIIIGGGWYRGVDRIALAFGLLACNHAYIGVVRTFDTGDWQDLLGRSWTIEIACYWIITWAFLSARRRAALAR